MTTRGWTLEKHEERLAWSGEDRASFYLAEKRERRGTVLALLLTVIVFLACGGAVWQAVWG